jgi:PAS domain S-box-containing protein
MDGQRGGQLDSALTEMGAAWWSLNLATGEVSSSPQCVRVLGLPDDALMTADVLLGLRPFPARVWRTLDTLYHAPDGRVRSRLTATRDAEGRLVEVFGLELPLGTSDAELDGALDAHTLSADHQLLRDILEIQPAMLTRYQLDGTVVWCNEGYAAHMGNTVEGTIGRRWTEMAAEIGYDSNEFMDELLKEIVDQTVEGSSYAVVAPMPDAQGLRWVQWTNRRVRDPSGGPDLVQGVGTEVTELRQARDALDAMARELVRIRATERRSLARRLHDDVVQVLVSAMWAVSPPEHADGIDAETASRGAELVKLAIDQLRVCLAELTTPVVLPGLMADAVQTEAKALRRLGIQVTISLTDITDEELRTVCTRVLVEAMRNVGRHSKATVVSVVLQRDGTDIVGCITDNGIGADANDLTRALASGHIGLLMSRAMVEAVGGVLEVGRTGRSEGTRLLFRVPLHDPAAPGAG